jgi:chromate transporter
MSPAGHDPVASVAEEQVSIPQQTVGGLFLRFLRFGCLAWGGPVAQIGMLKRELVDEERWITPEKFNRAYALYQLLPGPEAHELCVYFGTLARGRVGGLVAGLGFMLPGFVLMFALSAVYVRFGIDSPAFAAVFAGIQAAVLALIVRAVHRIGQHALLNPSLWAIAVVVALATLAGVHFGITLLFAGLGYELLARRKWALAGGLALVVVAAAVVAYGSTADAQAAAQDAHVLGASPGALDLFVSGLRTGLLTFGGAYTAIPLLLHDATGPGGWMTHEQFLDGIALGGILPAPLIIFATFVGYIGRGPLGALAITAGIFLPAFGFTLLGHEHLERVMTHPRLQRFLAGVTAGVVGLIAATTVALAPACIPEVRSWVIFAAALVLLSRWQAKSATAVVVALAGAAGWLLFPTEL